MANLLRASLSFLLIASFGLTAFADTIRMKDGSKIKGKIVSFTGGKFVIAMGDGTRRRELTVMAGEVDSIDFDTPREQIATMTASNRTSTPPQVVNTRPSAPAPVKEDVEEVVEDEPAEKIASTTTAPPSSVPANQNSAGTSTKKVSFAKPIELSVKVLADNTANGWTNSGWVVKRGQKIRISGAGEVSIGRGKKTGPSGLYDLEDNEKLLKSVPTGALIAVIGDDNNEFIYVGSEREFTASRDGVLFLGLNEGNLNDNTGSFDVKIEISPDGAD